MGQQRQDTAGTIMDAASTSLDTIMDAAATNLHTTMAAAGDTILDSSMDAAATSLDTSMVAADTILESDMDDESLCSCGQLLAQHVGAGPLQGCAGPLRRDRLMAKRLTRHRRILRRQHRLQGALMIMIMMSMMSMILVSSQ